MTLVVRLIRNKLFAVKNCGVIPFWPFMLLDNYSTFQLFSISNLAPYCNTLQLSYLYCLLYNKVFRMAILSFKMPLSQDTNICINQFFQLNIPICLKTDINTESDLPCIQFVSSPTYLATLIVSSASYSPRCL